MTHLRDQFWAVEVPEGAKEIEIGNYGLCDALEYEYNGTVDISDLPPGTWSIVCTSKDITRWQASELVEHDGELYLDYNLFRGMQNYTDDPMHSLHSLLTSRGLDLNKQYLILKKEA